METKKTIINGVEFYADRNSGALVAYNNINGVDTIDDAKSFIEDLLCSYIKEYPNLGTWSITVDTNDGHTVELRWSCDSVEEYDEFIETFVDNERIYDKNASNHLIEAFEVGEAKWTLANTTDEEYSDISKNWFTDHIERIIKRLPNEFTEEEKQRANNAKALLSEC